MYDHVNVTNQRLDLVIQRCHLLSQRLNYIHQMIDITHLMSDGYNTAQLSIDQTEQELREVGVDLEAFSSNLLTKIQNARKIH